MTYRILLAAGSALLCASAIAASDGTTGTSSEGRSEISMTVPKLIRITGLTDIALPEYTGTGNVQGTSDACVRTNSAATYSVTPTSLEGAFVLDGDAAPANTIAYQLNYGAATKLTYGIELANQDADATTLGGDCTAATVADKIEVVIAEADIQAVPADIYKGTLILTVAPE